MRQTRRDGGTLSRRREIPLVSVTLDGVIWDALQVIAASQSRTVDELVIEIAQDSLGLAIHIYIAEFRRAAASSDAPDGEPPQSSSTK